MVSIVSEYARIWTHLIAYYALRFDRCGDSSNNSGVRYDDIGVIEATADYI